MTRRSSAPRLILLLGILIVAGTLYSQEEPGRNLSIDGRTYPLYPAWLDEAPAIPSPLTTGDGSEFMVGYIKEYDSFALFPVTVENGDTLNYKRWQWGKGRQLDVDVDDFPTLAGTGLHAESELDRTKTITGRSIAAITNLGRPGNSSIAGFMAPDEDIISILRGDNQLVKQLGLTHPQLAKPLFHLWNITLEVRHAYDHHNERWAPIDYMLYNGNIVHVTTSSAKGWQESIFDDEILGMFQFEIWRELDQAERDFLSERYPELSNEQMEELIEKLSFIHTGEMVPYYIMRYGFYEGHTSYRTDPVAIAFIFGLKALEEIESAFEGKLYKVLTDHFTAARIEPVKAR